MTKALSKKLKVLLLIPFLGLGFSCSENRAENATVEKADPLFTRIDSSESGINYINHVKNEKEFNIFRYRNFYNGAGVGIGDINNDGLPDVYLTSNQGENKLYLNKGDFKFEDITERSNTGGERSWSTGVSMVDINHDGLLDIYVSNAGNVEGDDQKNELFINNGDLSFTEQAEEYQLDEDGFTTHAAFLDYDNDGDLDVYILNNSFIPVSSLGYANKRDLRSEDWDLPAIFKGGGDKLLQNNQGVFEDVSEEAGIYGSLIGFGLGVTIGDVNNDRLPDIYISNDFYERDYLYINQGDGTFKENIKEYVSHLSLSSMGADMADINNDGHPEIFVTDMLPEGDERLKTTSDFERYDLYKRKLDNDFYHQYMQNTLQLNNGNNSFSEIAYYSGVAKTDWSWGALMFDMDNDGYKDIYVSNGIYHDLTNQDFIDFFANDLLQEMVLTGQKKEFDSILSKMPSTPIPNYAFRNNQNLQFSNATAEWGFSEPSFSNGSAFGDLDNDGDLDLIVNNVNQELFVYRNNSEKKSTHNYLKVQLAGNGKNRFGLGSKINLYAEGNTISQELIPTRGFQSSTDYALVFGLGNVSSVDSLQVIWPDRSVQVLKDVGVNQMLELKQEDALKPFNSVIPNRQPLLTKTTHSIKAQKEDHYLDFDYEGLISEMLSKEGPAVAVHDINNDGNDDIYIGGPTHQAGSLYLQDDYANFSESSNEVFEKDASFEDTDAVFADINGDGNSDLIVVSGGNNVYQKEEDYETRIYLNKGDGTFSASAKNIPSTGHNAAVVVPHDYDQDGDVDLFIGSRSVPGVYGIDPTHQLLENDGTGNFKDVTESKIYELGRTGMITDATWADMDNDGSKDLVLVGDWISPKIFLNTPDGFVPYTSNLDALSGAWRALAAEDLNNDGRIDLILGNRGTNIPYAASQEAPMKLYINDFDNNGTIEQICTRTINGRDVPIHLRRELSGQIASVKKQNLKFSEYAKKSIQDLFPKNTLENSLVRDISTHESLVAYNNGDGSFEIEALPAEGQFSSIHAVEIFENEEGLKNVLLAGNNFNFKPQFSRLDASKGLHLIQDKEGKLQLKKPGESGFSLNGQVRALNLFRNRKGARFVLAALNNEAPVLFKIENEVR